MTTPHRETCRHGHPWTPENIYKHECRTCRLEQQRRFRERHPGYMTEKSRKHRERLAQHDRR